MSAPAPLSDVPSGSARMSRQIVSYVFFTFLVYLCIGIPLAVVPVHVQNTLGYSAVMAGLAISIQYVSTLISRPVAGRMSDSIGGKKTVQRGLLCGLVSGLLFVTAASLHGAPGASLGLLIVSRLVMGVAESFIGTGATMWAIGRVGHMNSGSVISWSGIATYGALAIGAPLGVTLNEHFGFAALGMVVLVLAALGLTYAALKPATTIFAGERMPLLSVFSRVLPHGIGLALGSSGFGALATFVTLFYASKQWPHAALSLTVFGTLFVGGRLLFANAIKVHGGFRVAIASLLIEGIGLALVWLAITPQMALVGAALSGLGFALVFPSLGVEAVALVPPASRGAALSSYSVFLDLSLGISGPLFGLIAGDFGYSAVYLMASVASLSGAALSLVIYHRAGRGVGRRTAV